MFIKKAREFTGLWVFDKWKGEWLISFLINRVFTYQEIKNTIMNFIKG